MSENADAVTMICPNLSCRRTVSAPKSARGMLVRCVYCNVPFRVPGGDAPRPTEQATADKKSR